MMLVVLSVFYILMMPLFDCGEPLISAFQTASTGSNHFADSLTALFSADTLAQPEYNSMPHLQYLKEPGNRKSEAILSYFVKQRFIPNVEPVMDELRGEAVCSAVGYDSFEYKIPIQTVNTEFTIRNVEGVLAGFCRNPVIALSSQSFTVQMDSAKSYVINLKVASIAGNSFRSLLTSGEVFITMSQKKMRTTPYNFSGRFSWQLITTSPYENLTAELGNQLSWMSASQFCLSHIGDGNPSYTVTNCQATDFTLTDPENNDADLCIIDDLCESFIESFCPTVTDVIIDPIFETNSEEILADQNNDMPICFPAI